jgi:PAS domain-containing protein
MKMMLKLGGNMRRVGAFLFSKSLAPGWVLLAALLALTYGTAYMLQRQTAYHVENFLDLQTDEITRGLETRFRQHESFMEMIAGLLLSSEEVTAEEWQTFISHMNIDTLAPEAVALGYARHEGSAYGVVYGGLASAHDSRLEHFDFAQAPVHRALIEKALHSGKIVAGVPDDELSRRLGLLPDDGALLLLERAPKGEDGFVFGIFSLRKTLTNTLDAALLKRARLRVFSQNRLFFDSSPENGEVGDLPTHASNFSQSYIGERFPWVLHVSPTRSFDESNFREEVPVWIRIFGTLLSLSFFTIIAMGLYIAKKLEERLSFDLHDRERRLETFLRRVPVSIVMLDQKSNIIAHSDRFSEAIIGRPGVSLIGKYYFDVLPDGRMNNSQRREHIAAALNGEEIEVGRAEYFREDG